MIHMKGEVVVNRPPETVFDFVADACHEPRYNSHILRAEKISSGPIGPWTRFRNETASMGRTTEWTIEITSYERPRRFPSFFTVIGHGHSGRNDLRC
ncbi:MAG: SRPBCC family protein [bacterium]|nr:SRPBCC family protein [bacterium]